MTDFLTELEALAKAATEGPWLRSNDPKKWVSTLAPVTSQEWRDNADNDAALIVLLRNNVEAILAMGRERDALRDALVQHNDRLRSACAIADRDGADTNWLSFRGQCHYTLAEYHELTNSARAALEGDKL